MKEIFKRVAAAVTALSVLAAAVVFDVPTKIVAEAALSTSAAGGCDKDHSGMTEWTDTTSLPTSGSYYLGANVAVSSETTITDNLTLCLNGQTIDAQQQSRIFNIDGGTLTLCDCDGNGKLTGGSSLLVNNNKFYGGAVYVEGGNFNMYGGTISNGTTSGNNATYGGGVAVRNGGTFTMSGGTISNNRVSSSGGGVYVDGGRFIMTGGTISYNNASYGGVYVDNGSTFEMSGNSAISHNNGSSCGGVSVELNSTFTMSGNSIISYNEATGSNGEGGVYVYRSIFTMNSGEIKNNTANNGIGGVELNSGTFTMNGGTISGNKALYGGGVDVSGGAFEMNGGTISGNMATSTDNRSGTGGGVDVYGITGGTFTMTGGTISGNTASNKGGGVYVYGGSKGDTFTMSGNSTISGNGASDGGGVYVGSSYSKFTMNGGIISDNTASNNDGGGVYVDESAKFKMNGGTISNNTAASEGGGVYVVRDRFDERPDIDDDGNIIYVPVVEPGGDLTLNGKVDISGNKKGSSANNVYLGDGRTITIESSFDTASTIGLYTSVTISACSDAVDVGITAKDISAGFVPDIDGQNIVYISGKVQLSGAHDWSAWETTKEPNATQKGEQKRICNNDPTHIETKELPATGGNESGSTSGGNSESSGNSGGGSSSGSSSSGNSGNSDNTNNSGNNSDSSDNSPGNVTNEVRQDENVPKTELATPTDELISAVLTPEEQAQLKDGGEVKFVLQVGDTVSDDDKQLAESSLEADEGLKAAQYMDVSLIKEINGSQTEVTKTNEPIKLTFEIPEALRSSARTFEVLRVYNGEATLLSDLDNDENTVTIETDILTTYVLVYRESSSAPDNGNPATGIAISLVPLAAALAFVAAAVIRKKK